MDIIDNHLAALNNKHEPLIQAALVVGKKHLNKYHTMTDHSELYRIAMGMCFNLYIIHLN
jgi:hypothetical protein